MYGYIEKYSPIILQKNSYVIDNTPFKINKRCILIFIIFLKLFITYVKKKIR